MKSHTVRVFTKKKGRGSGMMEDEAIKELKQNIEMPFGSDVSNEASKLAIKALEEIQKYRAIGTVEECREARRKQQAKKIKNRKLLRDFNKTVYSMRGDCPSCGKEELLSVNTNYCTTCGQKLAWYE